MFRKLMATPMETPNPTAIDCDSNAALPSIQALHPYLPAYWREQIDQTGFKGPVDRWYPSELPTSARPGTRPPGGAPAASQLEFIQRDVLSASPHPVNAILNCDCAVESLHNPDAAAAVAHGLNEWLAAEWLAPEPRLRASIVVPVQYPEMAAKEIELMAGRPGFVQVLLPIRSEAPYGSRNYRPIFAAAARHQLPVGLHFGGAPGNAPTPVGWTSFYLEDYAGMSSVFQTQLISLVCSGLFEEFPGLRVVLIEGGFTWLPPLLWRFDKNWKGLRREIPWVRRLPSEVIREHVRLTTAPLDAPSDPRQLREVVAQLGSDELLLYASDYPHQHGSAPEGPRLEALGPDLVARILFANPRAVYRF